MEVRTLFFLCAKSCVVWPPCLAILCCMGGDVEHMSLMCVYVCGGGGSASLGEASRWDRQRI